MQRSSPRMWSMPDRTWRSSQPWASRNTPSQPTVTSSCGISWGGQASMRSYAAPDRASPHPPPVLGPLRLRRGFTSSAAAAHQARGRASCTPGALRIRAAPRSVIGRRTETTLPASDPPPPTIRVVITPATSVSDSLRWLPRPSHGRGSVQGPFGGGTARSGAVAE
jgi:hypothetical protein